MKKEQIIIYTILIVIAIGLLYTAFENNKTNKELVKNMEFCYHYINGNHEEIQKMCEIPVIKNGIRIKNDQAFNIGEYYGIEITP